MKKLNLGCGQIRPVGWLNADSSMNTLLQRTTLGKWVAKKMGAVIYDTSNVVYMNLNKKWRKVKDDSIDIVYASHLFEHLEIDTAKIFLAEAYRVIKPNGCIRLVMPDLYENCKEYILKIDNGDVDASRHLLWALNLYEKGPDQQVSLLHKLLGFVQGSPHRHKYMYDRLSLTKLLMENGFKGLQFSVYGQSNYISDINDVEGPHLYGGYANSIYVEAIK